MRRTLRLGVPRGVELSLVLGPARVEFGPQAIDLGPPHAPNAADAGPQGIVLGLGPRHPRHRILRLGLELLRPFDGLGLDLVRPRQARLRRPRPQQDLLEQAFLPRQPARQGLGLEADALVAFAEVGVLATEVLDRALGQPELGLALFVGRARGGELGLEVVDDPAGAGRRRRDASSVAVLGEVAARTTVERVR
jgi:hypothetical protein